MKSNLRQKYFLENFNPRYKKKKITFHKSPSFLFRWPFCTPRRPEISAPIPTNTPYGSILYLGGLRAPDGTVVNNKRLGSVGADNIKKPIDKYLITHKNGNELAIIYISPYQAINSKKSPAGLDQVSPLL